MAEEKVHIYRGSTNGTRWSPRAIVKQASKKRRRAADKKEVRGDN